VISSKLSVGTTERNLDCSSCTTDGKQFTKLADEQRSGSISVTADDIPLELSEDSNWTRPSHTADDREVTVLEERKLAWSTSETDGKALFKSSEYNSAVNNGKLFPKSNESELSSPSHVATADALTKIEGHMSECSTLSCITNTDDFPKSAKLEVSCCSAFAEDNKFCKSED
jgi:hypothetical protein